MRRRARRRGRVGDGRDRACSARARRGTGRRRGDAGVLVRGGGGGDRGDGRASRLLRRRPRDDERDGSVDRRGVRAGRAGRPPPAGDRAGPPLRAVRADGRDRGGGAERGARDRRGRRAGDRRARRRRGAGRRRGQGGVLQLLPEQEPRRVGRRGRGRHRRRGARGAREASPRPRGGRAVRPRGARAQQPARRDPSGRAPREGAAPRRMGRRARARRAEIRAGPGALAARSCRRPRWLRRGTRGTRTSCGSRWAANGRSPRGCEERRRRDARLLPGAAPQTGRVSERPRRDRRGAPRRGRKPVGPPWPCRCFPP